MAQFCFKYLSMAVVALTLLCAASTLSATASQAAEQYVRRVGTQALAVARRTGSPTRQRSRFRNLIRRYADVYSIALFSLGPYRRKLPPRLRSQYLRLVPDFMARFFVRYADRMAGHKIEVIRSKRRSRRYIIVQSQVVFASGEPSSEVDWRLVRRGGGYKIQDIRLLGVWLSLQLRDQFVNVLRRSDGDFRSLIAFMKR
jgi:phospholipid transport system substrate-binding protein